MAARSYDLTDEEDTKKYIRDVEIEYQFQCFDQKEADGCHRLAEFRDSVLKNPAAGAAIYKGNCDEHKYPRSCFKYAQCLQTGKGAPDEKPDLPLALTYYEKTCDLDYPLGCYVAGLMRMASKTKEKNEENITKGVACLDKACSLQNGEGCFRLSGHFLTGNKVEKNLKKAFEYATKGCDLDHIHSCNNLSLMYRNGNGVAKSVKKANEIKSKSIMLFDKQTKIPPHIKVNE